MCIPVRSDILRITRSTWVSSDAGYAVNITENNSPVNYIIRARRYAKFNAMGAPEIVITEEGRCLAEEMVIYYYGKE